MLTSLLTCPWPLIYPGVYLCKTFIEKLKEYAFAYASYPPFLTNTPLASMSCFIVIGLEKCPNKPLAPIEVAGLEVVVLEVVVLGTMSAIKLEKKISTNGGEEIILTDPYFL
jgi:hypothetical protein